MHDELRRVLEAVRGAETFEDAAHVALPALLTVVRVALEASPFAGKGRVARAAAHLRTDASYRALAVLDADAATPRAGALDARQATSTSAWRWLRAANEPVAVDVVPSRAYRIADATAAPLDGGEAPGGSAQRSLRRILDAGTTHMALLPLFDAAGALAGMLSIEAVCRHAMGSRFVWDACLDELSLWADVLGPLLAARPAAATVESASPAEPVDPLLPVCGPTMRPIVRLLRVFAQQEETILLHGPTGVGKSRMARFVHERSGRRAEPFETVDLLAVPAEMQSAELFGWKKGAFTGAVADHDGSVARARGGTLFLDEIDKLSLAAQASLLQLIEARRYRVLGDAKGDRPADVRFVVGTNADLRAEVRAGRFREDLYYRVHVLPVALPALADRRDEIGAWAHVMLDRRHRGAPPRESVERSTHVELAPEAEALLRDAPWPGNLRQLDNVLRRAYVMALALDPQEGRRGLLVAAEHVRGSLAAEGTLPDAPPGQGSGADGSIGGALQRAARALVERLDRFDLDDASVFKSFVLAAAIEHAGSVEEAFTALGRESLVRGRNHHKTMQRELERLRAFYDAIGEPAPESLLAALGARGHTD